ncbi:vomeronasal type 1 receptor A1, partial [Sigmodon hispidus]
TPTAAETDLLGQSPSPPCPSGWERNMNRNSKVHTNSNTFFSEIGIGILANSFLLLFHILKFLCGHRPKPIDLPIGLLALIHLLMLLIMAFIATDLFISLSGWDDTTCKILVYLYRICRGLSLCTTSLLSVLQAIILSPRSSCLSKFKNKSPYHISCALLFLSIFYMFISSHLLVSIIATPNLTLNNVLYVTEYCSILPMSYPMQITFTTLITLREAFLISLIVVSSAYMVALLCRHKKHSKHFYNSLFPKASPEQRATQIILLLMSFFVLMSILDSFLSCLRTMFLNEPTSYNLQLFVIHIYATVSPFVFMCTEKHIVMIALVTPSPSSLKKMDRNSRLHTNSNLRSTFFSEIGIGISANSILLLFHIFKFFSGHRPKPTDLPIGLLALIHLLMLLIMAFIATDLFISWRGWDDITCKTLVYFYRICRGFSLCTTSLLSVLQAIILSPRGSFLAKFKHKSPYRISCALLFLSIFYMFISSHLLVSIIATPNLTLKNFMYVTESCSILPMSYLVQSTFTTLLAIREAFLISLMVISSGYMVALLFRHKKQTQHLHNTSLSSKASPEQRATLTILILLSFFVLMSILDNIISCLRTMFLNDLTSFYIQLFVVHIYATVSPFAFMCTEKHIVGCVCATGIHS